MYICLYICSKMALHQAIMAEVIVGLITLQYVSVFSQKTENECKTIDGYIDYSWVWSLMNGDAKHFKPKSMRAAS